MFTEIFIRSCGAISENKRSCFSVGLFDCRGYLNVFNIVSFTLFVFTQVAVMVVRKQGSRTECEWYQLEQGCV